MNSKQSADSLLTELKIRFPSYDEIPKTRQTVLANYFLNERLIKDGEREGFTVEELEFYRANGMDV